MLERVVGLNVCKVSRAILKLFRSRASRNPWQLTKFVESFSKVAEVGWDNC
jgi:hypothetical protein